MDDCLPFDDSRRLTGYNVHFADVGAVLETTGIAIDDMLLAEWSARVRRMRAALDWPDAALVARKHASGASLALAAPLDQLFCATEVNEWALLAALDFLRQGRPHQAAFHAPGHAPAWDEDHARRTLCAIARAERNRPLVALAQAGRAHACNVLIDDERISLGLGRGSRSWPLAKLPTPEQVDWHAVHDGPIALVTGSNGKTTTTRLLAALMRAHGWRTAYTCTDGVFVDARALAAGDYSGPAGARTALRAAGVDAAVLETARGGLLRRGLAVQRAAVAIVTNVSDDHFGEYGVHDLDDLADVKLVVAHALDESGVLVLNADDPRLIARSNAFASRRAWFALDADAPQLLLQRARGAVTCSVCEGRLHLHDATGEHDLGEIDAMPLAFGGTARYNIANIAAAALGAHALGIDIALIAQVLATFGRSSADNPGRLQYVSIGGVGIFIDYAHNPDGLRGVLEVATHVRTDRLALLLGQAGNREDAEIRELAAVAASFDPDLVVIKEITSMLRGRAGGEVPAILREELARSGLLAPKVIERPDEIEAARAALAWSRAGDVLVMPIHGSDARLRMGALLATMEAQAWSPGARLPT